MILSEMRQLHLDEWRMRIKQQMREGAEDINTFTFSEEEVAIIREEVEIEDFYEIVEDFEEIILDEEELEEALQEEAEELQELRGDTYTNAAVKRFKQGSDAAAKGDWNTRHKMAAKGHKLAKKGYEKSGEEMYAASLDKEKERENTKKAIARSRKGRGKQLDLKFESYDPMDSFEFIPSADGSTMDIMIEVDHEMFTEQAMDRIAELFFAEEWELVESEDDPPFDPDPKKKPTHNSDGSETKPASKVKQLANKGMNSVKEESELEESHAAKIVFKRSKGEVVKKKKCAKGMRLVGNKCLPQTGTQKGEERRRGIKLKRAFKAMGAGKKKKAQIKKKITDRRVKGRARNLANTIN